MPVATMTVITPAIGSDHNTPAADASTRAMPMDDPVPNHVQVKVKDKAASDHTENLRGM